MSILSDPSLHPSPDLHESTRKRKRHDDHLDTDFDKRPFTIRPDASDPFARPRIFTPISLIPRADLPLASLDTGTSGSRLFTSHIHILETCHEHGWPEEILIAEECAEKRLYAIERTTWRTYALCRLGLWVTRESIEVRTVSNADQHEPQPKRQAVKVIQDGQPWWSRATAEVAMPHATLGTDNTSSVVLSMLSGPLATTDAAYKGSDAGAALTQSVDQPPAIDPLGTAGEAASCLTPEEHFQELAKQYLSALYLSRTSLAYFAKGPLSRVRAAFINPETEGHVVSELATFLREAIIPSSVVDKKYREGLDGLIQEFSASTLASPDQVSKKRNKRKWKSKRDKQGFFVNEKEYVEQWWMAESAAAVTTSAGEQPRTQRLRGRETYLQIIIALEVLALETARSREPDGTSRTETLQYQEASSKVQEGKATKSKKMQDLPALLETLVDKLCIWHSLDAHSPAKGGDKKSGETVVDGDDELGSFCIEVIIPFYMSRIPEHASMVNKKLGGPSAASPTKRRSGTSKPGEPATRRPPEKKPRNPLARVATDGFDQDRRQVPSLARSATDSDVLQNIKREGSQTPVPMDSIPSVPPPRKRTSLMHSASFSKREVDFSAMSQANRTKLRKKAEVEEKLKEAISAIKKPSRALAVKEVAENTDMSFAQATAKGRPAMSSRVKSGQGVHVTATPKQGRTSKATPGRRAEVTYASETVRSSATSFVPSTSARAIAQASEVPRNAFAIPQTGHRPRHAPVEIEDTPSRGFAKFMPMGLKHSPGTLHSPTTMRHASAIEQTPSKPANGIPMAPLVPTSLNPAWPLRSSMEDTSPSKNANESTIYNALGWDDEYETLT